MHRMHPDMQEERFVLPLDEEAHACFFVHVCAPTCTHPPTHMHPPTCTHMHPNALKCTQLRPGLYVLLCAAHRDVLAPNSKPEWAQVKPSYQQCWQHRSCSAYLAVSVALPILATQLLATEYPKTPQLFITTGLTFLPSFPGLDLLMVNQPGQPTHKGTDTAQQFSGTQ